MSLALDGVTGCAGDFFHLSAEPAAVPALSVWLVLLLGAAAAGHGAYRLRHRALA